MKLNTTAITHYTSQAQSANDVAFELYMKVSRLKKTVEIAKRRGNVSIIKTAMLNLAWAKKDLADAIEKTKTATSELVAFSRS